MRNILFFFTLVFILITGCKGMQMENTKNLLSFESSNFDICLVDINTKKVVKLISSRGDIGYHSAFWLDEHHLGYLFVNFSPTLKTTYPLGVYDLSKGKSKIHKPNTPLLDLRYASRYDDSTIVCTILYYDIKLLNISTMDTIPLVNLHKFGIRQNIRNTKVSPNKSMIIFAAVYSAKNELLPRKPSGSIVSSDSLDDIYVYHIPNDSLVQLTNNQYCDKNPTWSPDGEFIAFSSNRTGNFEIFIMDRHGNNTRQLTNNPAEDDYPEFSAEGDKIAFTQEESGKAQIWLMNTDGSNAQQLTDLEDGAYGPLSWSPAR